jgi:hypothetical protein
MERNTEKATKIAGIIEYAGIEIHRNAESSTKGPSW